MPGKIIPALAAGLLSIALALPATRAMAAGNHSDSSNLRAACAAAIRAAERAQRLPVHLLRAVALAESGRWDDDRQASFAWPWTVTSGANGQFFRTKAEAIAAVRRLQARGVRNIDVGCLQINLRYHPDAFDDLEEAFDPDANAGYAAGLLRQLRTDYRSWASAVARYHSGRKDRGNRYRKKVFDLWKNVRVHAFRNARERQMQAYLEHRARMLAERAARRPLILKPAASPPRQPTFQ